jgi:signal transduction histidine kinase
MPTAAAPASCVHSQPRRPAPAIRYGIAGAAVVTAGLLNQSLRPLTHAPESALFVAAVLVTSWLGGLGPGLLATGLSVVTLDVVMSPTTHSFALNEDVLARLAVFLVVAVFSSALDAARRRAAAERVRAFEREREARTEAEAANRAKDEFVAMVAHELRTPLSAVAGWTTALRSGRLDSEGRAHALEVIQQNVALQARIIEDIVDLTRIARGALSLQFGSVDLREIVVAAGEATLPTAAAGSVRLDVDIDAGERPVWADAARLQQATVNLLVNAIKHSPPGSTVRVRAESLAAEARIEVTDEGCGIAPEFLPHVFERYRQGGGEGAGAGLGLGLAIVREVVELHGGRVEASSPGPGHGACFTIVLPAAETREPSSNPAS